MRKLWNGPSKPWHWQGDAPAEQKAPLPELTPIPPSGSDLAAYFMISVTPPGPSERVNVYLPKSLVERIDRRTSPSSA